MGALDVYNHYKFYHFFSICFGLGCGLLLYRPFYTIVVPSILAVFFTVVVECVGASFGLPAHTVRCKGRPYHWKVYGTVSSLPVFIQNIFNCVPKTNKAFMGLERHGNVVWGYCMAFLVTILHLRSYHVYTLSCGFGLIVFAIRGAIRKYNALWKARHYCE